MPTRMTNTAMLKMKKNDPANQTVEEGAENIRVDRGILPSDN
jgi:hypothetical protein